MEQNLYLFVFMFGSILLIGSFYLMFMKIKKILETNDQLSKHIMYQQGIIEKHNTILHELTTKINYSPEVSSTTTIPQISTPISTSPAPVSTPTSSISPTPISTPTSISPLTSPDISPTEEKKEEKPNPIQTLLPMITSLMTMMNNSGEMNQDFDEEESDYEENESETQEKMEMVEEIEKELEELKRVDTIKEGRVEEQVEVNEV